ncbi:MAG TPA: hypothetical protein VFD82_06285, partial [Planctomycetota bacterium]|nr:hypothetical protein [Planctomycetota bacterium]
TATGAQRGVGLSDRERRTRGETAGQAQEEAVGQVTTGIADFVQQIRERLDAGAHEHGDRSLVRSTAASSR